MKKILLSMIEGVHKEIVRFECELNLSPVEIPDPALIDKSLVLDICKYYPLTVHHNGRGKYFCIGQTTLYRWLAAHMPEAFEIECIVIGENLSIEKFQQAALIQRVVARLLAPVTPLQAKFIYEYVSKNSAVWPNNYKSNAGLSRKLGVVALKSSTREGGLE